MTRKVSGMQLAGTGEPLGAAWGWR
jgi:hypothetical protein